MATDLYRRMAAFNYEDVERLKIMLEVWESTPWMVDAFTGGINEPRWREMTEWCGEQFGPEAWPLHGRPGLWQRGCATVFGWTWFGFSTKADMEAFEARWPTPDEQKNAA